MIKNNLTAVLYSVAIIIVDWYQANRFSFFPLFSFEKICCAFFQSRLWRDRRKRGG
jgi:hypothetical protein